MPRPIKGSTRRLRRRKMKQSGEHKRRLAKARRKLSSGRVAYGSSKART